jgi:transposase, IS5 family
MLRLEAGQVLSLWDEVLPIEARELPEDLRRIDALLADSGLLAPIRAHWDEEAVLSGRSAVGHGRPTIAMASYVRLMVVKQRSGWGYETLVREVSDSLHLRRFCLIAISERVPDESTIRKLTRRLGHETVDEITRLVIAKAQRETRFLGRAVRVDSTVIEADIRYPSDAMLALQGTRALAREGRKLAELVKGATVKVRDRSRSVGRTVRQISKTLARRTGQAKQQVIELNSKAGTQIAKSAREARRLAAQARRAARGRGAKAKLHAAAGLEQLAERCEKIASRSAAAPGG